MTTSESPRTIRLVSYPIVWLQHLIGDGMLGSPKGRAYPLVCRSMPGQRFDDSFGGEPLVDKERQGRHIERERSAFPDQFKNGLLRL